MNSLNITRKLLELYEKDLRDLEELKDQMSGLKSYLQRPATERPLEELDAKVQGFLAERNQCFKRLQERAKVSTPLQQKLKGREDSDPEIKLGELAILSEKLTLIMTEVLDLDKEIIPKLERELHRVKAELNRLEVTENIKNAYQDKEPKLFRRSEARFIDTSK